MKPTKGDWNKFIDVFDDEAHKIEDVVWLAQGTIYPDVIESVSATGGPSATIKSHHNVGGLPDFMKLKKLLSHLTHYLKMKFEELVVPWELQKSCWDDNFRSS